MNLTIDCSFLPYEDADASLTFYRDVLGFEVRLDVGAKNMRWITLGPAGQPDTAVVLQPAVIDGIGISESEAEAIRTLMAKGLFAALNLATDDVDATFAALEAKGTDVIQEPMDQPYGVRDCAVRDPAGNMVRIKQK